MKTKAKKEKTSDLRKLQLVLLEMLNELVRICDKHNLTYFLVGGTALGAIRHKGFIPWDDDIDIGMPREDFEKFIKVCLDDLDDKYFLDHYSTNIHNYYGYAKLRKNNTTFVTEYSKRRKGHDGFFIDIFPMDYNTNKDSLSVKFRASITRCILETLKLKEHNYRVRTLRRPIISLMFYPFSRYRIHRIVDYLYQKDNKKEHKNMAIYSTVYFYKKDIYPVDVVMPPVKATFEGHEYNVYHDTDKYLKQLYGDYMKLPKEEDRISHLPDNLDFNHGLSLITKEEYNKLHSKRK
ncbi:MAG: LicD family protein [Bacilli bacterium]|nr:LicD family protein [Bacilli bacterium]